MRDADQRIPTLQRALVIESDATIHGLFEALLTDIIAVDVVRTLEDALAQACQQSYDMVLIGLGPHTRARFESLVLEGLRSQESRAGVPIIAVTTQVGSEERKRLLEQGFDGYVTKPFSRETLLEGIIEAFCATIE